MEKPARGCLSRASACVDGSIQKAFYNLGYVVGSSPWLTIVASIAFIAICCAGVTQYHVENEGENLWVPPSSIGLKQLRSVRNVFPASPRTSTFYFLPREPATSPSGVGVLTWPVVETMFDIEAIIGKTTEKAKHRPEDAEQTWSFDNLCQKVTVPGVLAGLQRPPVTLGGAGGPPSFPLPPDVERCYMTGITDLWAGNKTLAMMDKQSGKSVVEVLNDALRTSSGGTIISPRTGRPMIFNTTFGGVSFGAGGNVTGASVTVFTFQLENRQFRDVAGGVDVDPAAEAWEVTLAKAIGPNPDKQTYTASRVVFGIPEYDAVERATAILGDLAYVGGSIVIILLYLVLQFRVDCTCVGSRVGLALAGGLTVGLSLGFAYGIGSLMAPYTTVHSVLPFILAGVGVDDLFVIANEFSLTDRKKHRKYRLAEALKHGGSSITVTSLTDFLAFFIGSSTSLPAFSAFCQWAGLAILGVYILACTFFSACVVLDASRQEAHRADCCCCVSCAPKEISQDVTVSAAPKAAGSPATSSDVKASPSVDAGAIAPTVTTAVVSFEPDESSCCSDEAARRCIKNRYAPCLLHPVSKVIVLVLFFTLAAVSAWGVTGLSQEFREEWFIPANSPLQEQVTARNQYFGENGVPVSAYAVNFTLGDQRLLLLSLQDTMSKNKYINQALGTSNWYREFLKSNSSLMTMSNADFHREARTWLAQPANVRFNTSLVWTDAQAGFVRATRINGFYVGLDNAIDEIDAMQTLRSEIIASGNNYSMPEGTVFASSFVFANWEQLVIIPSEAIQNIALAIAACFVVVLVFLASPVAAVLTTFSVALILLDILAAMVWWGISLNGVSVVNLTLAIGLSVDYSAHIAHAFMHKHGSPNERAALSLSEMGVSVINGGMSTFLAVVVLAGSSSYIFSVFFRIFFLSVVYGLSHGLVFLPVVLSLVGPSQHEDYTPDEEEEEQEEEIESEKTRDVELAAIKPKSSTAPAGGEMSLQSKSAK